MESLQTVRFIGGFAMAGSITPEEYTKAKPDPLAAFADHVIGHMNDDHSDATVAMVQHYAKVPCSEATITSVDRLGMTVSLDITASDSFSLLPASHINSRSFHLYITATTAVAAVAAVATTAGEGETGGGWGWVQQSAPALSTGGHGEKAAEGNDCEWLLMPCTPMQ